MIDRSHIGTTLPPFQFEVEKGRLRFFAKAIGETRPEYFDEDAARAAGYRSIPAPPTFLMAAEMDSGATEILLDRLGIPIERVLHGEQSFTYHGVVCAGDRLELLSRITDIYAKKGGALEFIVKDSTLTDLASGRCMVEMRSVIVVRNPQETAA